jgi:oligoendopeptidase F
MHRPPFNRYTARNHPTFEESIMAKSGAVPHRSQVRKEDTWDLSPLYKDDKAWHVGLKKLEKLIPRFEAYRGKLGTSAETLLACLEFETAFNQLAERVGSYAFLRQSEDVADGASQAMVARYTHAATRAQEAASYLAPEIQAIPDKKMKAFLASPKLAGYKLSLERLLRYKPHILSLKEERLLAMQGEVAGTASRVFDQLNDADLKFGEVKDEKGRTVELTQSSFRSLLESPDRRVRKEAFDKLYAAYDAHANTIAATLSASVLQDIYQARARNYPSCIEASLFHDKVPVAVYDSLIEAVRSRLDTVHRYLEVRRKALKLRDIRFYDTYVPIVRPKRTDIPFDQASDMVCDAMAPLGAAYCDALRKGLREQRWADRYENKGKRSGAFSAGGYTGPPYILMNYRADVLDSVFTLAHEAGHSMHTWHSARHQPYQYYDYTIFVAEVASTFNEQLLNQHLIDRASDPAMKAYLINREIDEIRGTIVRQTMFAEFEKVIHAIAEAGEPLTLEVFREEYRKLLDAYFGPKFKIDEALSLEGLRIPHFYRAFYVYKYATGLSAAIALSRRVLGGGVAERDAYLTFLKGGCSKFPLDLLRDAGVDMEQPEPVADAMDRFSELVTELEALV